jgi:hypothetical protein
LFVSAVELDPAAVTLTSVLATALVGVLPPGSGGPPDWITVTRSVPTGPDDGEFPADPAWLEQPALANAIMSAMQASADRYFRCRPPTGMPFPAARPSKDLFTC